MRFKSASRPLQTGLIDLIVSHSSPLPPDDLSVLSDRGVSKQFGAWDGKDSVRRLDGTLWPLRRVTRGSAERFEAGPSELDIARLQGVLNEVLTLGRQLPLRLDMKDARDFGEGVRPNPATPLVAYNRRSASRNVALWPLPGYHTIGGANFAHAQPVDRIPYQDKIDRVAWRGNLTGCSNYHYPGRGSVGRFTPKILGELQNTSSTQDQRRLMGELRGVPRFRVVEHYHDHPDFDVAFALSGRFDSLAKDSIISRFCDERRPRPWFHQFRYVLCLSGHDTGSNFFDVASSNSVMLKEDDGWQLFYSAAFRPWEHFIPLERGAGDLTEKLEWARSHPRRCRLMAQECQAVARQFADSALRVALLHGVLDSLQA